MAACRAAAAARAASARSPLSPCCTGLGCGEGTLGGVCGASASSEIAATDSELLSGCRPVDDDGCTCPEAAAAPGDEPDIITCLSRMLPSC